MRRRDFLASLAAGWGISLLPRYSLAAGGGSSEFRDASNNRDKLSAADQPFYTYFSTATAAPDDREKLAAVLCGIVPSLSHKTDLQFQIPKQVTDTLWRIDLRGLGWEKVWHSVIAKHYPYFWHRAERKYAPLVVRADWFCSNIYDGAETADAQYQFLYSGAVPKTRDEFFKFWKVQNEAELIFGMVEGRSGVAKEGVRQIENRTTARRGYFWLTKDSRKIAGKSDPLEQLHKGPEGTTFDAQEFIVGIYKVFNGKSGCLQAYFLSDAKGNRQEKAPVDIVEDTTNTRGREIRNSASCIYCHTAGIQPPTQNEYRRYITRETQLHQDYASLYRTERYHGSDLEQEVQLNQILYEDGIRLCTGMTGAEFSRSYQLVVQGYTGNLGLAQLARELGLIYGTKYMTPNELQLALGYASSKGILGARASAAAEEDLISRNMADDNFILFQKSVELWQGSRH